MRNAPVRSAYLIALVIVVGILGSRLGAIPEASAAVNCCHHAFVLSDIQPHPGELVVVTGIVTDQYGTGQLGVQVTYSDTTLTSKNATSDSRGVFQIAFTTPQTPSGSIVSFTLSMHDAMTGWRATATDSYAINQVSGDVPVLYFDQATGGRGAYVRLESPSLPAVIYIGGGYELDFLHGVNQLDAATTAFLDFLSNSGFNVLAPVRWFSPDYPSFPLVLGALLKYGFLITRVYLLGWSAGGVAAAWALTNDVNRIFSLAVIMDAELDGPSEANTRTPTSVFTTAQSAGKVTIPHLLIWGENDPGNFSVQKAAKWVAHASPGTVRLDALPYSHAWLGTNAERLVREDIATFFATGFPGTNMALDTPLGNYTERIRIVTNLRLSNITYDPSVKILNVTASATSGDFGSINIIVPVTLFAGEPIVMLGSNVLRPAVYEDAGNYYVFFTLIGMPYTQVILVGGEDTIPEVPSALVLIALTLGVTLCAVRVKRPRAFAFFDAATQRPARP